MRKVIHVMVVGISILLLAGCASRSDHPAGVTDANALQGGATSVQTQGLGLEDNLAGSDVGPHDGILNKRSYYFGFDKSSVNSDDYPALKAHAQYLLNHANARVLVTGNCDERGSREYNIALGQRRANSVADILRMEGVPKRQLRTVSYGSEKPVALGHTETDYQVNRRDDLIYEAN